MRPDSDFQLCGRAGKIAALTSERWALGLVSVPRVPIDLARHVHDQREDDEETPAAPERTPKINWLHCRPTPCPG